MKFQQPIGRFILAVSFYSSGALAFPAFAHQSMSGGGGHHGQQQGDAPNMMGMMGNMGGMDMSNMMGGKMGMGMMRDMGMGMGMMQGMGMGMMRGMGISNLTDEQQESLGNLHDAMRKTHWELMGVIIDEQSNLRRAMSEDRPDPNKVGEIYARLAEVKRKMVETRVDTHNKVRDLLTDEQMEQMKGNMMMKHQKQMCGNYGHGKMRGKSEHGG